MRRAMLAVFTALLLAAPAFAGHATLTFTNNAPGTEANFNVERVSVPNLAGCTATTTGFVQIAAPPSSVPAGTTVTYVDTTVAEGATYCYRVAASNPAGESGYSNAAGITVPCVTDCLTVPPWPRK
jgi:hypothetical protein